MTHPSQLCQLLGNRNQGTSTPQVDPFQCRFQHDGPKNLKMRKTCARTCTRKLQVLESVTPPDYFPCEDLKQKLSFMSGGSRKGGFQRVVCRMFLGAENRNEGVKNGTTLPKKGTRVAKTERRYQKPERGYIRQNRPKLQNRPFVSSRSWGISVHLQNVLHSNLCSVETTSVTKQDMNDSYAGLSQACVGQGPTNVK